MSSLDFMKKAFAKSKRFLKTLPVVFLGGTLSLFLITFLALFIRKKQRNKT
jgi:hypothetical protein